MARPRMHNWTKKTRDEYHQIEIDNADANAWDCQHVLKWLLLNYPKIYYEYIESE